MKLDEKTEANWNRKRFEIQLGEWLSSPDSDVMHTSMSFDIDFLSRAFPENADLERPEIDLLAVRQRAQQLGAVIDYDETLPADTVFFFRKIRHRQ